MPKGNKNNNRGRGSQGPTRGRGRGRGRGGGGRGRGRGQGQNNNTGNHPHHKTGVPPSNNLPSGGTPWYDRGGLSRPESASRSGSPQRGGGAPRGMSIGGRGCGRGMSDAPSAQPGFGHSTNWNGNAPDAPHSNVLHSDRPYFKPAIFVPSVLTRTLFDEDEETLEPAAKSTAIEHADMTHETPVLVSTDAVVSGATTVTTAHSVTMLEHSLAALAITQDDEIFVDKPDPIPSSQSLRELAEIENPTVDIVSLEKQIRRFISDVSGQDRVVLPPMNGVSREGAHELACAFNLKSKSKGKGAERYITLIKSKKTCAIDERKVMNIIQKHGGGSNTMHRHKDGYEVGKAAPKIGETNLGFRMLASMGWAEGDRIGGDGSSGIDAPLKAIVKTTKLGLGATRRSHLQSEI